MVCFDKFCFYLNLFEIIILDIDEVFRVLPIPMDNMNPDIIRRRKYILEQYIQVDLFERIFKDFFI